jgi:hypothetical protein
MPPSCRFGPDEVVTVDRAPLHRKALFVLSMARERFFIGSRMPAVSGGPHVTDNRTGKKPVVWPVRSTAWFGWERPVSRAGVLPIPRPCSRLYLITSSAWKRMCGGMVRPRAFAVFKLMTSSNFMGCSTGRAAGLLPFRMRST